MDDFVAAAIVIALVLIASPALAVWALVRTRRLAAELRDLRRDLAGLRVGAAPAPEAAPEPPPVPPQPPRPVPPRAPAPAAPARVEGLEERLTSRWLVWLGAVTLALAGVFLVKYSIDRGWLNPPVRCALGAVGGMLLIAGGEWLRRRPLERAIAAVRPSYVPPALAAAGVAMLYTSVYAAYALYALLAPLFAFIVLAAVSALGFALALLHGPFIAVLGLLGGFLVPALVSTGEESALALFPFVLAVAASSLAVVRFRAWWRIAWLTLAGAVAWPLVWFAVFWHPADAPVLAAYLLLAAGLFLFVRERGQAFGVADQVVAVAGAGMAVVAFVLVRVDGYHATSLVALGLLCALYLFAGRREARFDALAALALALVLALLAVWHLPQIADAEGHTLGLEGWRYDLGRGPIVPPRLIPFAAVSALFAALFAGGGFVALWGARRPWLWASVSAAAPVLVLGVAFWRVQAFGVDLGWAVAGLLVAGLEVVAAERLVRHRHVRGLAGALGAYAMGAAAALGLAMAMALERAWLTVALALLVPALAAIHDRLPLAAIRRVAWVAAAVVVVRLVFNYKVLGYPAEVPGLGWMIYGYGLPALAFAWAATRFRAHDIALVRLLEAAALAFATLLVTLEIRHLVAGGIAAESYTLLERSLQSIAWAAIAYGLYRRDTGQPVHEWGWRVLAGLATAQVVLLHVVFGNPLVEPVPIGRWPLVNLLLLAYGVPALFALLFLRAPRAHAAVVAVAGPLALILPFVELSLEVRRAFHGRMLGGAAVAPTTDAEWYAYSLAWLAYAGALLALGIVRGVAALRYASLALVMLTVAKLFLFDMSALTGLYRVASFLGLGLSLVAIGYLYQRYVFPPRSSEAER